MRILLLIGTGSFIGGICRYLLSQFMQSKFLSAFPFGTLSVNVTGCFLIGIIFGFTLKGNLPSEWRLFLATGICGGFTTFSAFSTESFILLRNGQFMSAFIYIACSILLGLLATFLGVAVLKLT